MPSARRSPPPSSRSRSRRRQAPPPRRSGGSDLLARIVVAVPAAIVAIVFIDLGGIAFALFMLAIGLVCLHELYRLLARWRPLPLVGFGSLIGMVLAARYGSQRVVLEVAVATVPVLVLFVIGRPQHGGGELQTPAPGADLRVCEIFILSFAA